ncbi:hypothetical protein Q9295_02000 [Xinfangfangia sp. CPCC 101601]|uniref:Uncharacterized protein n=1 Tax=Pseudogemmobacter lacusdianii TaxID=3069608 RepID=A0ABU0VTS0_9RHOB|nr:hypothetical protein [Xinfangfangia sp. CPCC 101601]MDQ2065132.1 hypothetical protein [Xinfangfangia sp. CPCC 101601]
MLRTILIGSCVSVQGLVVGETDDGKLMVQVDAKTFIGTPITSRRSS